MFEWFLAYMQGELLAKLLVVQYKLGVVEVDAEDMLAIDDVVPANTGKEVCRIVELLYYIFFEDHKVEREGKFIAVGEAKRAIASFRTDVCYLFGSHSEQEVGV